MNAFDFLVDIIEDLADFDGDLERATKLESLNLVSLDYIEILVLVKKKFSVTVKDELFESRDISTLGEFSDYIESNALEET